MVRPITTITDWRKQRKLWRQLHQGVPPLARAAAGS